MEYTQDTVVRMMMEKQSYLNAFPRHKIPVKGCKQFIYFDDGTFYNVQFNLGKYAVDEVEYFTEEEFREVLGNLAYETVWDIYLTPYDDIPETCLKETRERKTAIDTLTAALHEETKWLKLLLPGCYLHYTQILSWHRLHIKNDKIHLLSLLDDAVAQDEINAILAKTPDAKPENATQEVVVDLFLKQKQAIKYINTMVPGSMGLIYRDGTMEEGVKIVYNDVFYSFTLKDGKIDRFHEANLRVMMEDLVGLLLDGKTPEPFQITEELKERITERIAGMNHNG